MNRSDGASQISEKMKNIATCLQDEFEKINKNLDTKLTKEEVLEFLDKGTRNKRQFDRVLANKIFSVMDQENIGELTVGSFIKTYVILIEEIKQTYYMCRNQLIEDKQKVNEFENKLKNNNEHINEENLSENSKINLKLGKIIFNSYLSNYSRINILINYQNKSYNSGEIQLHKSNIYEINQTFQFIPRTLKDDFEFILQGYSNKNASIDNIANANFNIVDIQQSLESYETEINLVSVENSYDEVAKIKADLLFYWSDEFYFSENLDGLKKNMQKHEETINKCKQYFDLLAEPLKKFDQNIIIDDENIGKNQNDYNINKRSKVKRNNQIDSEFSINDIPLVESMIIGEKIDNNQEINEIKPENKYLDKIENIAKNLTKKNYMNWMKFIKISNIIYLALSLINSFYKVEFINIFLSFFIFYECYANFLIDKSIKDLKKDFKFIYISISSVFVFDLIWMIINGWKGSDIKLFIIFTYIFTLINELFKILLLISFLIQESKMKSYQEKKEKDLVMN